MNRQYLMIDGTATVDTLRKNDQDPQVRQLQKRLVQLGYPVTVNGDFDAQRVRGMRETGGNYSGPFVVRYFVPAGLGAGDSWCAAVVSWCFIAASGGDSEDMPFPLPLAPFQPHVPPSDSDRSMAPYVGATLTVPLPW